MALDAVTQLGEKIGKTINTQDDIKQNIRADSADAIDSLGFSELVLSSGTVKGTAKYYASDSFIIDHPVLGDIDSPTLKIDGGYLTGELTVPITMPVTFTGGSILLFEETL